MSRIKLRHSFAENRSARRELPSTDVNFPRRGVTAFRSAIYQLYVPRRIAMDLLDDAARDSGHRCSGSSLRTLSASPRAVTV